MVIAITFSVLAHAALLAVRFVAPDAFKLQPADPGLEVILVNAKHANRPIKADAIAQANLDGGGQADAGRSKSPLPDMRKSEDGDSLKAMQKKIAEYEAVQQNLLTRARNTNYRAPPVTEKDKPDPARNGNDLLESSKAIARATAEISTVIDEQNKRPKKTFISPSTQEVGYAMYYKAMQKRVEEIGTLNFPQVNGRKMYGEMILEIPVFQDGTIYVKDGGVMVKKSSGNPALDKAALAIVRRSAPFGKFPPNMLSSDKDDVWIVITRFNFTREEVLRTNVGAAQ
ncbi:energy transducer TonB [Massilia eurypsychrophila]|uniref:Energy transducer TonB n=1 Tax=Massilia eurypsychrophila TaxID=1485217 RepID=A0A2G8TJE5_9BURK|nr:energy transducer TonB [Massilia eurypsychrophila]PIL46167.1 energy transducer TonB [Massilia eurypsychrophila]